MLKELQDIVNLWEEEYGGVVGMRVDINGVRLKMLKYKFVFRLNLLIWVVYFIGNGINSLFDQLIKFGFRSDLRLMKLTC